jgi:hypothetical protein
LDVDGSQHLAATYALLKYRSEKDNAILMLSRIAEGMAFSSTAGENRSQAVKGLFDLVKNRVHSMERVRSEVPTA